MDNVKQHKYESEEGMFTYVIMNELSEENRKAFSRWLRGSQVPIVKGVGDVAYSWDYDTWLNKRDDVITKQLETFDDES